jgi:hypothetical protein
MASQVTVIAILMIVQGVLELLAGLLFTGAAFFVPAMLEKQQGGGQFPGPGLPANFKEIATIVYLVMGVCGLVAAGLHLVAGIRNLSYRGRTLGLVALFAGAISIGTCYCSLTTIGLLIYGAIVYFNEETARAFELGEQGLSVAEIRERLQHDRDFPGGDRGPDAPRRPRDEGDEDWLSRKP